MTSHAFYQYPKVHGIKYDKNLNYYDVLHLPAKIFHQIISKCPGSIYDFLLLVQHLEIDSKFHNPCI